MQDEVIEVGVGVVDVALRVVGDAFHVQELAVGVVHRYLPVDDTHSAAVFVHNGLGFAVGLFRRFVVVFVIVFGVVLWRYLSVAIVHLNGAVPIGVGKEAGDVAEIHNGEMRLAFFLAYAGATAYNLFELRHGVDVLVEYYQFHHLAVHTG